MIRTLEVYSRDPDLVRRGPLPWQTATITLDHLGVSAWQLTMPATARERVAPGWGVFVTLDRAQILSGSVEDPERVRESNSSLGSMTVSGADDLAIVASALAWPDPTAELAFQGGSDARSGVAETVIKGYVGDNIGTTRATVRRDPAAPGARQVTVAPDLGRGAAVEHSARYTPLMEVIRACHGGLGITCQQSGSEIVFDVFEPQERPSAVFSHELGNLRSCRWRDALPEVTHAIVGGDGEGAARPMQLRADSAAAQAWRMAVEEFVDERTETSTDALDAAGDQALADGRRAGIIEATLADTPRLRFGQGYGLGDYVTVSPEPGVAFTDQITSVVIEADRGRGTLSITPSVGWVRDGLYTTRQDREISQLRRAVGALQRSL
ncbi:siphovirus ReqiPepy6 Gp37-like family protein [Nocardiopsis dassonvillei]|uniref:siphovirus ReqiPepy6 Gp37-like family protein n=1 Tax=Nocardiopsis dassonvillei TaxID=2014 RepID=UPI00364125C8